MGFQQTTSLSLLDKYDPQVREIVVGMIKSGKKPPQDFDIDEVRAHPEQYRLPCWVDSGNWDNVCDYSVVSKDGSEIMVRVYRPESKKHGIGPFPVHLNFHGGGFVLGDLGQEASLCSKICDGAGVVVVDVNYRHCPEAAWGRCFEDAWAALLWVRDSESTLNIKPNSISIGGISAGGHVSLVLQHLARDNNFQLRLCLVTVPVTSNAIAYKSYEESPFQSFSEFRNDVFLPWYHIEWFGRYSTASPTDNRALPAWWFNPLQAPNLKSLCKTFIRTAEVDILRDEGEAYGRRLVEAGNEVMFKRYLGMPHLFPYLETLDASIRYTMDTVQALKAAHTM
ncbi:Fc.00g097850.m01.CDS01 [Cosmosporella sp. VM-42]